MFKAEVIAASYNTFGQRATTMLVTFPRIILAELNTHRMLSRNSASSRAIPFKKMVEAVMTNPFIPLVWLKDHKGMQGKEELNLAEAMTCEYRWLKARDEAVRLATEMNEAGLTKQLCNRLLEPFMWHTVLISGTEWENFFALRAHEDAEVHMQELAEIMLEAYNVTKVRQLQPGEWHMPYAPFNDPCAPDFTDEEKLETATGRAAQISYTVINSEGKAALPAQLKAIHDKMVVGGHWSPFEHCMRAMTPEEYHSFGKFEGWPGTYHENHSYGWLGNVRGFIQYRKLFPNENQRDERVKH